MACGNYTCLRDLLLHLTWYCDELYQHYEDVESTSNFKAVKSIMDAIGKLQTDDNYGIYMLERKFKSYHHYSVEEQEKSLVSIKRMIDDIIADVVTLILRVQDVNSEYETYTLTDDAASEASTRP
eukprot:813432-Rhodomonas_salina.1